MPILVGDMMRNQEMREVEQHEGSREAFSTLSERRVQKAAQAGPRKSLRSLRWG